MSAEEKFFTSVTNIVDEYEKGFVGAYSNPEAAEALRDEIKSRGGIPDGAEACTTFGLAESGKNKVVLPFLEIISLYADCLPGGAQGRGDCVSWSARNAALGTMCCEITSGKLDPVSGKTEGAPWVTDVARLNGVLSTEAIYNWRRHGGDGWSCAEASRVMTNDSGLWLRQNYPELGVDFTQYSSRNAGIYGSRTPPDDWREVGRLHLVQTVTEVNDYEDLRDLLANGYCVSSCGGESFSDTRDENGVSNRTARGWAHAMAYLGVDDREEVIKLYGSPLILVQNSWGDWNSGGRRVYKKNYDIPVGSFWARWTDLKNRYAVAVSGVNGWPPKKLKSLGATGNV